MTTTSPLASRIGFGLVAIAVLLAGACNGGPQQQRGPAGPARVSTVTLETERVTLTTELPGRTAPYLVAEIRPQVSGIVQERPFTEGADVARGDLLYRIDPAPYQAAYDEAEAALALARADLPALESRAERLRGLAEAGAAGEQDADDAEAALRRAEANVQAAEAALERARVNLSYTPITSPISGRIGRSLVTIGALVTAHQPQPLAVVQTIDPIYVDVTQATSEVLRLRREFGGGGLTDSETSRSVRLLLEDGTPYPETGTLKFRDISVDPTTGSVTVRMVFPNPDQVLLPGMFVRAVVEEGVAENALLVPQQGVTRDQRGEALVWVVTDDGVVEQRMLEIDRAIGSDWLVTGGVEAGDRVIVEGRQKVRPGDTVDAVPFTPAADERPSAQPAAASAAETE